MAAAGVWFRLKGAPLTTTTSVHMPAGALVDHLRDKIHQKLGIRVHVPANELALSRADGTKYEDPSAVVADAVRSTSVRDPILVEGARALPHRASRVLIVSGLAPPTLSSLPYIRACGAQLRRLRLAAAL